MSESILSMFDAFVLGVVEGFTEYLPISSTGHLIMASELLGLHKYAAGSSEMAAIQAYEIVIQSGAILAVLGLYKQRVWQMLRGLMGKDPEGLKILINLIIAFIPASVIGLSIKKIIESYLQFTGPVLVGLVIGGVFMILYGQYKRKKGEADCLDDVSQMTPKQALAIGFAQSLALWPGTSRSMVTISGGLLSGLSTSAATEFSFLLGLPTLLAATAYKSLSEAEAITRHIDWMAIGIGLFFSAICAALTVKWMIKHLSQLGLVWFGWYRIAVAIVMGLYLGV